MAKALLLFLIVTSCCLNAKAQCPPSTQAIEVIDSTCAGGCHLNLNNWPDGVTIYVFDESGDPAVLITSAGTSGSFGDGGLSSDTVCVPCSIPIAAASEVYNASGCLVDATPVLAVLFNHFTVVSSAQGNTVSWTVSLEQQNISYIVQRSNDCKTFTDLVTFKGLEYAGLSANYSYTDTVLTQESFCYRLKAIESNGTITYSNTASTSIADVSNNTTQVYPNPFTGNSFRMNIPASQLPALVSIYTMQGQLIYSEEITTPLPTITASFPGGIYALKVTGNEGASTVVKLIKE